MRQIERMMLTAIENNQKFSMNNTTVIPATEDDEGQVLLHGNLIAVFNVNGCRYLIPETLERWPIRTTISRLRALGFDVRVKKGEILLGKEAAR